MVFVARPQFEHYRAKVGCFECHDIHGTQHKSNLKEPIDNNALCLSCHKKNEKFTSATAIETHTKHPYDPEKTGSSRCTSCHLQRSTFNTFLGDGPSHHFQIVTPELSLTMFEKYEDDDPLPDYCKKKEGALGYKSLVYCYSQTVIPNSCNGCHKEWGTNRKGYEAGIQAFNKKFQ